MGWRGGLVIKQGNLTSRHNCIIALIVPTQYYSNRPISIRAGTLEQTVINIGEKQEFYYTSFHIGGTNSGSIICTVAWLILNRNSDKLATKHSKANNSPRGVKGLTMKSKWPILDSQLNLLTYILEPIYSLVSELRHLPWTWFRESSWTVVWIWMIWQSWNAISLK